MVVLNKFYRDDRCNFIRQEIKDIAIHILQTMWPSLSFANVWPSVAGFYNCAKTRKRLAVYPLDDEKNKVVKS
jgi:hypothetical protein